MSTFDEISPQLQNKSIIRIPMSNTFSNKLPVDMFARLKAMDGAVASGEKGEEKNNTTSAARLPIPPLANPAVVDAEVKRLASAIGCFVPVASYTVGSTNQHLKFSYPTISVGVTRSVWSHIQQYFGKNTVRMNEIFNLIDSWTSTNCTIMTALTRLGAQMPLRAPVVKYDDVMFNWVMNHLPMKKISERVVSPDFSRSDVFDIIPSADAGMPFMATKKDAKCGDVDVYKRAIELARKYMVMLSSPDALDTGGEFKEYMRSNRLEFAFILKRKFERIKREDFHKKVRSYFVAPYALKLLFKWVSFYVREQSLSFLDNPQSSSAYRFSWSNGGATNLVRWIKMWVKEAVDTGLLVFRAVCFGDDQLWVFCYGDGCVDISCPDFAAMDMHVPNLIGQRELMRHLAGFEHQPSTLYVNVCRLLAIFAFSQEVIINGSLVMHKKYGLVSGVPLTTQFDIHCSVLTHQVVESQVKLMNVGRGVKRNNPLYESGQTKGLLERSARLILERIGLTIKPETLQVHSFRPDVDDMLLPFLGYTLKMCVVNGKSMYYPVPADLNKAWVSAAIPSAPVDNKTAVYLCMARLYGLLASGYCFDPEFDGFARDLFAYMRKNHGNLSDFETNDLVMDRALTREFVINHPDPPSAHFWRNFYLGCDDEGKPFDCSSKECVPVSHTTVLDKGDQVPYVDMDFPPFNPKSIPMSMVGNTLPSLKPKASVKAKVSEPSRAVGRVRGGRRVVGPVFHDEPETAPDRAETLAEEYKHMNASDEEDAAAFVSADEYEEDLDYSKKGPYQRFLEDADRG